MYVFFTVNQGLTKTISIDIVPLGEEEEVWASWERFDAAKGSCFNPNDKVKILAIIGADLEAFNREVLHIVEKVHHKRAGSAKERAPAAI